MAEVLDPQAGAQAAPMNPLQDRTFVADMTMEDDVATPVVDGTQIRLSFRAGHIDARGGCNAMDFAVRVEPDRLYAEQPMSTLIECDQARMAQDAWLMGFLTANPEWSLSGRSLELRAGHEWMDLDEEVGEGRPLSGRSFRSVSAPGLPQPLVPGTSIVLTFTESDALIVDAGCNRQSLRFSTGGDAVIIDGPFGATRMACSPELMEQDARVAQWLTDQPFTGLLLVGNTLSLFRSGEAVLVLTEVPVPEDAPAPQLWDTTFETTVVDGMGDRLVVGSTITFTFSTPDSLNVQAGCNSLSFQVRTEPEPAPGRLIVGDDFASTDMACDAELEAQDEWLARLLVGDPFCLLDRGALTLTGADGTLTLFARP